MKIIIVSIIFLSISFNVHSGDFNFETSAEGIATALTNQKSKKRVKTRGLKGINVKKTRSIKVVGEEKGLVVEKTVLIPSDQTDRSVNLKIEFDVDSSAIRSDSFALLDELGKALTGAKLAGKDLAIIGHTDSDGDVNYNLKLSLSRAVSVKTYLTTNFQIEAYRLTVFGYGESLPLVPDNNTGNKQLNRRVEITLKE